MGYLCCAAQPSTPLANQTLLKQGMRRTIQRDQKGWGREVPGWPVVPRPPQLQELGPLLCDLSLTTKCYLEKYCWGSFTDKVLLM